MNLKDNFYRKLPYNKVNINWNKKPIKMDLFLSFLTVETQISNNHLGASTGWTMRFNKDIKLEVKGGIVNGVNYLDSLQYGAKLNNPYNNYVSPFEMFEIMTSEGIAFFLDYYKDDIEKIMSQISSDISFHSRKIEDNETLISDILKEIERFKTLNQNTQ